MNGHKFLKVTGILMIIAAAFSILAGVLVGGLGALAAGVGAASVGGVRRTAGLYKHCPFHGRWYQRHLF